MKRYPKCKYCKHSKSKHNPNNSASLKSFDGCLDCWNFYQYGATYEWEIDEDNSDLNIFHQYSPDNLAFLEKKYERKNV